MVIDERDQAALDDQESENNQVSGEATVEQVSVTKRVRHSSTFIPIVLTKSYTWAGTSSNGRQLSRGRRASAYS